MKTQALARQRPLLLVRDPFRKCLEQAAHHLEHYHLDPSRRDELALCDSQLQQAAGCLTMLELPAARQLVSEMRALSQAIGDPQRLKHERCAELLICAALFLPRYLDYVHTRGHETPALLLPTINLMRFVRRAGLIPEHEFVSYQLPTPPAARAEHRPPAAHLVPRIRQLRHLYQVGLLGVIRNRALEVHLRFLSHTLDRLQQLCGEQEPWQLTQGLLEALLCGSLTLDISIKHMLGRVDRQIRDFALAQEAPVTRAPDQTLRDHLLYYLAKASPGDGRVSALQARYQLAGHIIGEDDLEQERQWLQTPDHTATGAVAESLLGDLAEVKSGLLKLQAPGGQSGSLLRTLLRRLDQIALTLEVLGLDSAMRQCRSLARQLPGLAGDQAAAVSRMAEQLVSIEATLQAYAQGVPSETLNRDHCENLRLAEDNTLREARQAIAGIRQLLEDYFDPHVPRHDQHAILQDVLPLLQQVTGALRMLELTELAALLEPLASWLGDGRPLRAVPTPQEREPMIEAIASVEWVLEDYGQERRQRQRPQP